MEPLKHEARVTRGVHRIKWVYVWSNGLVMVFDENGAQIPELQGHKDKVWPNILASCDGDTEFFEGDWQMLRLS